MKTIRHYNKTLSAIVMSILFSLIRVSALPVISELNVIGGERGVALIITADSPFDAEFSATEKNVVVTLKRCIYGIPDFKYTNFPSHSPLLSISAIEKKDNSVEVIFRLKSNIKIPLKTVRKENRWLALLSESPTAPFKWSSSEQISSVRESDINEQKERVLQHSFTDSIQKSLLEDIYFIQRANICELSFVFNREIKAELKKEKNSIVIRVDKTENSIANTHIKIPDQQLFKDIYIKKDGEILILTIFLNEGKKEEGLFFVNRNVISLLVKNPSQEKLVIWHDKKGVKTNYSFIDFPVYSLDLIAMGKRAKKDSNTKIPKGKVFEVALTEKSNRDTLLKEEITSSSNLKPEIEQKSIDSISSSQEKVMKVIARSVNIRAKPSIDAQVIGKLNYGELVYVKIEEGKWYRIEKDKQKGYVFSSFLKESEEKIDEIGKETNIVSIGEEINTIRKVSAITDVPEKIISETTAVVFLKDETDSTKSTINKVIRYNGRGRDPFVPILPSALSADGLPFVENLVLVGILYDDNDKIALCEDQHNNSRPFSLREHDPVVNGKVLKIYKDKVVFLITEYGISRSYTLRLEDNSNLKEVSKR